MQPVILRLQGWLSQDQRRRPALALLLLCGLCALAYGTGLADLGLMDKTEGLFAEVPRQMLASGDWVTPRWNGELFFDYPVWGYWMVALSYRLFGLSEGAARLPAALAASATVLALFAVLLVSAPPQEPQQRRVGRATLTAAVLALSPGWVGWGRSSVTDMFLASGISLALLGYALSWAVADRPATPATTWLRRIGHGALALFCGVAVLAKGPVGVLLPGLVIGTFLLLKGQLPRELRRTPWLPMLALFLGVTTPWYAAATAANGTTFLSRFLGFSNLERFTSVLYSHPGPPWFYLPWVMVLLLPWSLFLPVAISRLRCWRLSRWRAAERAADLPLLALLWLTLIVAFFSAAATKLPGYILPALPGGALLVGSLFIPFSAPNRAEASDDSLAPGCSAGLRWSGWLNALLLALAAVAAVLAPHWIGGDPAYPAFADAIAASPLPWLLAIPLALAALALVLQLLSASPGGQGLQRLWLPNAAAFVAILALVIPVLTPLLDRQRLLPIRSLARLAARQASGAEPLLVVGYKRYSVVYYSGRPVLFVDSAAEASQRLASASPGSSVLLLGSDPELLEFGIGPGDASLLARRDAHQLLRLPLARLHQLGRH